MKHRDLRRTVKAVLASDEVVTLVTDLLARRLGEGQDQEEPVLYPLMGPLYVDDTKPYWENRVYVGLWGLGARISNLLLRGGMSRPEEVLTASASELRSLRLIGEDYVALIMARRQPFVRKSDFSDHATAALRFEDQELTLDEVGECRVGGENT